MAVNVIIPTSSLAAEPGQEATLTIRVRNASPIVDAINLDVLGDPGGYARIAPSTLQLFPDTEGEAIITFAPPLKGAPPGGDHSFAVRAVSGEDGSTSIEEGTLTIGSLAAVQASIVPRTSTTRRRATHRVEMTNLGNAAVRVQLEAVDPDDRLVFKHDQFVEIPAGTIQSAYVKVELPRGGLINKGERAGFQVQVRPVGAEVQLLDAAVICKGGAFGRKLILLGVLALIGGILLIVAMQKGGTVKSNLNAAAAGKSDEVTTTLAGAPVDVVETTLPTVAPGVTAAPTPGAADPKAPTAPGAVTTAKPGPATTVGGPGAVAPTTLAAKVTSNPALVYAVDGDIFKANTNGTTPTQLTNGKGSSQPTISRDGKKVAYAKGADVLVVDAINGGTPARVAAGSMPAWKPDGSALTILQGRALVEVDLTGKVLATIGVGSNPSYDSTGGFVAYDSGGSIMVWDRSEGGSTEIATGANPAWAPRGTQIAFEVDGGLATIPMTNGQVSADPATAMPSRPTNLAKPPTGVAFTAPAWSSDGRVVLFVRKQGTAAGDIASIPFPAAGAAPTLITKSTPADETSPANGS